MIKQRPFNQIHANNCGKRESIIHDYFFLIFENTDSAKSQTNTQASLSEIVDSLLAGCSFDSMNLKQADPDFDTEWPLQHGEYRCFPAPLDR